MTKGDVSKVLEGFREHPGGRPGLQIYNVAGWDYPALCTTYYRALELVRSNHQPAIIHVTELTQPLGHSTSGSHERYKPPQRLVWEKEYDCLRKMQEWIVREGMATPAELEEIERLEKDRVEREKDAAWRDYRAPLEKEKEELLAIARRAGGSEGLLDLVAKLIGHGPDHRISPQVVPL